MKICYVANGIDFPYRGGAGSGGATHVYEIARGLVGHGHSVFVLASRWPGQAAEESYEGIFIRRVFVGAGGVCQKLRKRKLLWEIVKWFYYIWKLFIESVRFGCFFTNAGFDVVYERTSASTWLRAIFCWVLRKPLILEVNDYYHDPLSLRIAMAVISPNKDVLPDFAHNKARQLSWGANIERFRPGIDVSDIRRRFGLEGKRVAGMVCSGLAWHGLNELIEAAKTVSGKMEDIVFMIVGGGGDFGEYTRKVSSLGLEDNFFFTGSVDYFRIPEFISLAEVTVAPYNSLLNRNHDNRASYASPLKVFEYMACGKPVVITEIGNRNNIVENLKTGLVIPEDSVDALAEAIISLFNNKDLRDTLGRNARRIVVEKYSWQNHVMQLNEVLTGS